MKTLVLKNVSRTYKVDKTNTFVALATTNLSFDSSGLVSIVGSSGSGKSTLINLISRIDSPSTGEIFLNGKSYKSIKSSDTSFYKKEIGIVFQQYHLLVEDTVIYNVLLPLLMSGVNKLEAINRAEKALLEVGISKELFDQKAKNLSGGEAQRVAIARAIINEPKILLCDEPTGALDSINSIGVMKIIKKISEKRLVILVSHNLQLVKKYSDRIIEIVDGKIVKDINKKETKENIDTNKNKIKDKAGWTFRFSFNNYKRRFKRNLFSMFGLTVSLTSLLLICGFTSNKDNALKNSCYQQADFASGTISKTVKTNSSNFYSLSRSTRPELNELLENQNINKKFEICLNFDSILSSNVVIKYDEIDLGNISFVPIYNFDENHFDSSLLIEGKVSELNEEIDVLINENAYRLIRNKIGKEPLFENINVSSLVETNYIDFDNTYISDTFNYSNDFIIKGVVKEIDYLSSPKIYYSYSYIEEYLKDNILLNLSTYKYEKISWYDRVILADNNEAITSYSYRLFLKDYRYKNEIDESYYFGSDLVFTSPSIILMNSMFDFLQVAEYGALLFLIISLVGTVLIISIISFTSFNEDREKSAILVTLGASSSNISDIYLGESLFTGLLSLLLSVPISLGLSSLINLVVYKFMDLKDLIIIPFMDFLGLKFIFPLLVLSGLVLLIIFSTLIPLRFAKRNSIKEELQSL